MWQSGCRRITKGSAWCTCEWVAALPATSVTTTHYRDRVAVPLIAETVRSAPKVLLHDHLDGGVRPQTIVDLALAGGHQLPSEDPVKLGRWFREAAYSGSLERYLETFGHTVAVMQDADSLVRVAAECA